MYKTRKLLIVLLLLWPGELLCAQVTTYTDRSAFLADLSQTDVTLTWETLSADTLIPHDDRVRGITFSYLIGDEILRTTDAFAQTTEEGKNSLGLTGPDASFLSGDAFMMTFDIPTSFVGLYVIGSPGDVREGDITLSFGGGLISNAPDPGMVLPDGGQAYFLGIIATGPFSSFTEAVLVSNDPTGSGLYVFNADDIIHHGCVANLDDYGSVTFGDLALFGQYWLMTGCEACGGGDFTGDQNVMPDDLSIFITDWLCGM
ncbi:MAG: hypothetical protein OEW48_19610 [Phycisphaerae bacterium]|nr:hypothetical protein [Phycisphaerae bacterium]